METVIRNGVPGDMPSVYKLITELAVYEKAPNEVVTTAQELERDCFENRLFDFIVADKNGDIVGFALFYTSYSTWKGKCLYLEDFLVTEKERGSGIGKQLFEAVVKEAKKRKVRRMDWQVLEWNQPAIGFYKKNKALLDPEWINGRLFFNIEDE